MNYFFFIIINATVVQLFTIDRKRKRNIDFKNHLPTTVTQCWIPPRKSVNLISVVNGDMSRNVSYPYCSLNNLYKSLYYGFTFYLTSLNFTSISNWRLYFDLNKGVISYLNFSASTLSTTKKNEYENEHNKQAILTPFKRYNLRVTGTVFLITPTFVRLGVTSKGPFPEP